MACAKALTSGSANTDSASRIRFQSQIDSTTGKGG